MLSQNTVNLQSSSILETGAAPINARYDSDTAEVVATVNGRKGGRIKRNGSHWKAVSNHGQPIRPGDKVHVIGKIKNKLILLVEPWEAVYV